jgi:hypothetical protein
LSQRLTVTVTNRFDLEHLSLFGNLIKRPKDGFQELKDSLRVPCRTPRRETRDIRENNCSEELARGSVKEAHNNAAARHT